MHILSICLANANAVIWLGLAGKEIRGGGFITELVEAAHWHNPPKEGKKNNSINASINAVINFDGCCYYVVYCLDLSG